MALRDYRYRFVELALQTFIARCFRTFFLGSSAHKKPQKKTVINSKVVRMNCLKVEDVCVCVYECLSWCLLWDRNLRTECLCRKYRTNTLALRAADQTNGKRGRPKLRKSATILTAVALARCDADGRRECVNIFVYYGVHVQHNVDAYTKAAERTRRRVQICKKLRLMVGRLCCELREQQKCFDDKRACARHTIGNDSSRVRMRESSIRPERDFVDGWILWVVALW